MVVVITATTMVVSARRLSRGTFELKLAREPFSRALARGPGAHARRQGSRRLEVGGRRRPRGRVGPAGPKGERLQPRSPFTFFSPGRAGGKGSSLKRNACLPCHQHRRPGALAQLTSSRCPPAGSPDADPAQSSVWTGRTKGAGTVHQPTGLPGQKLSRKRKLLVQQTRETATREQGGLPGPDPRGGRAAPSRGAAACYSTTRLKWTAGRPGNWATLCFAAVAGLSASLQPVAELRADVPVSRPSSPARGRRASSCVRARGLV